MRHHRPSLAPPQAPLAPRRLWALLATALVAGCGSPELDDGPDNAQSRPHEQTRAVALHYAPGPRGHYLLSSPAADGDDGAGPNDLLRPQPKSDRETPVAPNSGGAPRHLPTPPAAQLPATAEVQAPPKPVAEDHATIFLVQRQEYGFWTHYLLQAPDGAPLGVVERRHWRQPWRRCYEATDAEGLALGRATQPWLSVGNVLTWHAVVRLEDAAGERLGHLKGSLWTLRAASYDLYSPAGHKVAQAAVDDCGQGILIYAADGRRLVATMLREQQATRGSDRWNVRVEPNAPLATESWPLIAAFFADAWSALARGCEEG